MPPATATRTHLDTVERRLQDTAAEVVRRLRSSAGRWSETPPRVVVGTPWPVFANVAEIEERTMRLWARQAPVGRDVARIASLTRCVAHLGRAAVLVGRVVAIRSGVDSRCLPDAVLATTERLGMLVAEQFDVAVRAWSDGDVAAAEGLRLRDDEIDEIARQLQDTAVEGMPVEPGLLARHHARIGDHAVGLGDEVVCAATGTRPLPRRCPVTSEDRVHDRTIRDGRP